jgi:nicotinamide mononucleotide transporter
LPLQQLYNEFYTGLQQTGAVEMVAVISGIISVWFSRKESIWVYPTGLINTILFIYISVKGHLLGEASVNLYYTIMSLYGWWLWTRKDQVSGDRILHITSNDSKDWQFQLLFFGVAYGLLLGALTWAKASLPLKPFHGPTHLLLQLHIRACGEWQKRKWPAGIGG